MLEMFVWWSAFFCPAVGQQFPAATQMFIKFCHLYRSISALLIGMTLELVHFTNFGVFFLLLSMELFCYFLQENNLPSSIWFDTQRHLKTAIILGALTYFEYTNLFTQKFSDDVFFFCKMLSPMCFSRKFANPSIEGFLV